MDAYLTTRKREDKEESGKHNDTRRGR